MAQTHTILAQHIELPRELPDETTASWQALEELVYLLAVVFGVLELPGVDVLGVWSGKEGTDWQEERVKLAPRSPTLKEALVGDLSVVETHEELVEEL